MWNASQQAVDANIGTTADIDARMTAARKLFVAVGCGCLSEWQSHRDCILLTFAGSYYGNWTAHGIERNQPVRQRFDEYFSLHGTSLSTTAQQPKVLRNRLLGDISMPKYGTYLRVGLISPTISLRKIPHNLAEAHDEPQTLNLGNNDFTRCRIFERVGSAAVNGVYTSSRNLFLQSNNVHGTFAELGGTNSWAALN
jgi:hypothetical protein